MRGVCVCVWPRKSTPGGCLMVGRHIIKTLSATQACVAPSFGEAEFYGVVQASGIALGHKSLLKGDRDCESCAT